MDNVPVVDRSVFVITWQPKISWLIVASTRALKWKWSWGIKCVWVLFNCIFLCRFDLFCVFLIHYEAESSWEALQFDLPVCRNPRTHSSKLQRIKLFFFMQIEQHFPCILCSLMFLIPLQRQVDADYLPPPPPPIPYPDAAVPVQNYGALRDRKDTDTVAVRFS